MRIGPFHITRLHRHRVEKRYELPWDVLTTEHLSEGARALIARVARSAAKDALGELLADDDASYLITRSVYERAMNDINEHLSKLGATPVEHQPHIDRHQSGRRQEQEPPEDPGPAQR